MFEPVLFQENVRIPMRDGIRLATDIYRPAIKGVPVEEKIPIIFQRIPLASSGPGIAIPGRSRNS